MAYRPIPGYEGLYEASPSGYIRSLGRIVGAFKGQAFRPGRKLKNNLDPRSGYTYVYLVDHEGERKSWRVHTLVLITYVGPCPQGKWGYHLNRKRGDNRAVNLVWASPQEVKACTSSAVWKHGTCNRPGCTMAASLTGVCPRCASPLGPEAYNERARKLRRERRKAKLS